VSAPAVAAIRRRMSVAWLLALVLAIATATVAEYAARVLPRPAPFGELAYYPSGRYLRPATLGHAETAADLAWLRAVQYYGERRRTDNRFDQLEHVFDILTSLSPGFDGAYVFGAFALAQEGGRFPQAERLILSGLEHNPRSGELAFETGFLYYVRPGGRDLRRAAEYFELAARLPGSPPSATRFAAFCRQNAGSLEVAYELWSDVFKSTQNQYMREIAARQMQRIHTAIENHWPSSAIDRLATPQVRIRSAS